MRIDSHLASWENHAVAEFVEALQEAVKGTFCSLTSTPEKLLSLGEEWYNNANLPGFPSGPTPLGQGLRGARNVLCGEVPDDISSEFEPSVPGGQCPGTVYTATSQVVYDGEPPVGGGMGSGPGPLKRVRGTNDSGGSFDQIRDANDNFLTGGFRSTDGSSTNLVNIVVNPVSGPDDCGDGADIPPDYYRPNDFTSTPNVTYDPPGGGPSLTVPVGLVYAPVMVNVDGRVVAPVDIQFNTGVNLRAEIDLNTGDVNYIQDIDVTLPTPVEDPTVLPDPVGIPGDPPTEEENIERSIIGIYVQTTDISDEFEGTELLSATGANKFYVPRLASVSFHCEVLSAAGLGWTEDIDVKYDSQVVYCPIPWGAKAVAITEQPGITLQATIIRGEADRSLLLRAAGVE